MTGNQTARPVLGEISKFSQHGKSGAWVSDFLPQIASISDDLCFVKSLHTEAVNHAPAITYFMTGSEMAGRPSLGAWLSYGLGNETEELPAFVVMTSRDKEASCGQIFYDFYWGSGFLPTKYQGVAFRGAGDPVLYLSNPAGMSRAVRRGLLDDLAQLNEIKRADFGDPEITTRIAQYEMAYKMQASVPELTDFSKESASTLAAYGPEVRRQGSYAYNCLMARRLAERGVRFTQVFLRSWDNHNLLPENIKTLCEDSDRPTYGLITDLKRRGLLDDTLVIWGGEFGRTVYSQGTLKPNDYGRDHHPRCFSMWMAGAGMKPGLSYGQTDDFSYNIVKDPVHIRDLHATILHQFGLDHERLSFKFQGLDQKLTGVLPAKVITDLLA